MELYLQFGYGMKTLTCDLLEQWGNGTIILSPVNITQDKIKSYSTLFKKYGGKVLFDPQLFFTKDVNEKLTKYNYWPSESSTISNVDIMIQINSEILKINKEISSDMIIMPSRQINEHNYLTTYKQIKQSTEFFRKNSKSKIIATVALSPETIRNSNFIEEIVNDLVSLDVDGFYVVPQPPNSEYIVTDGLWSIGILKLLTCLKFSKKFVIVGYSNHQGLVYSLANVDAIASGNFMNTRVFSPEKFKKHNDAKKQKSNWFYVPNAMCEFKAIQLDIAKQRDNLELFKPVGVFENKYSSMLFSGLNPSSTSYTETDSFKHYLHCLRIQCLEMKDVSYDKAFHKYEFLLSTAENKLREIKRTGISGQRRDFEDGIESNRVAMIACNHDYGFKLKLEWQ